MKSNKGITLISLVIFLIVLLFVIGIISTFTKYFYRNTNEITISNNTSEQYSRFITYITEDVNSKNITYVNTDTEGKYINIYFQNSEIHQYIFDTNKIYYISLNSSGEENTKIELCNEIEDCSFEYTNSKIKTKITINSITYNDSFSVSI